ncbi:MAG: cohesin domain-containing protein [Wujia sp.]
MGKIKNRIVTLFLVSLLLVPQNIVIYAKEDIPVQMEIMTTPKVLEYCVGDKINTRGLSVAITYDSGAVDILSTGYSVEYDFSQPGKTDVMVSYAAGDTTVQTSYSVNVYECPILKTSDIEVYPGNEIMIPVYIENNCGLMGIGIQLEYNPSELMPISVDSTDIFTTGVVNDNIGASTGNIVDVIWTGTENISDDGKLCDVAFYCKDSASAGISEIKISATPTNTYNENYNTITCKSTLSTVDILQKQPEKKKLEKLAVILENWEEGSEANTPVIYGNEGDGKATYLFSDLIDGEYTTDVPDKAGKYYVKAVVDETEEYYAGQAISSFEITEKQIVPVLIESLNLNTTDISIIEGDMESYQLAANILPENATNTAVKWISTNNSVAVVDSEGVVTFVSSGTAVIIALTVDGSDLMAFCNVRVEAMTVPDLGTAVISSVKNTSTGVKIAWSKANNADGYYVYRKAGKGNYMRIKKITDGNVLSYVDSNAVNGATYTYKIVPYSGAFIGAGTEQKTMSIAAPQISDITSTKSGLMNVKWDYNNRAVGYQIQYSTSSSFSGSKTITIYEKNITNKTIKGLTRNKRYYVRVRTFKTSKGTWYYSAWSNKGSVKIK